MSGWQQRPTDRRATLPRNWTQLRLARFRLDGFRCTAIRADTGARCEAPATDCDHVGERLDHRIENLRSLCSWHHKQVTAQQSAQARKRKKPQKQKHPGII